MTSTTENPDVVDDGPEGPDGGERIAIEKHRRGNRWMHWINFPVIAIMIWSGLRIYAADVRGNYVFGIGSWDYELFPNGFNEALGLRRRLARGIAFHLNFAWFFVLNGVAFGLYLWRTGGWRNFIPTKDDLRTIPAWFLHDIGLRKEAPPQGKYNGLQQITYAIVLMMGVVMILTGFTIYRPTQLSFMLTLFGGYEGARFIHFSTTMGFVLFFFIHVLQVARAGFGNFWSMVTGYEVLPASKVDAVVVEDSAETEEVSS